MPGGVYLAGIGIILVTLAFPVTESLIASRSGVSESSFDKIQTGMTRAEVEAIFGGAPRDFYDLGHDGGQCVGIWESNAGTAFLHFDGGRVVLTDWEAQRPRRSPFARLRSWLGL